MQDMMEVHYMEEMKGEKTLEHMAKLASKGDEDSFVALCEAMKKQLFRAAKGILAEDSLALEAVSEAVFRAYKGIRRLRQPQYVATWFTRILINAANDIYKRQKREIAFEEPKAENVYYDDHDNLNFQQMIDTLPIELRKIVSLKYYSEFTLEEISRILRSPVGTVKSRLNRALKQLRMEVEE